jgi:cell division protein FtsB
MPNIVKGSKQEKMVVVPYRPGRRLLFTTVVLIGVAASALGGFAYGYYTTMLAQQTEAQSRQELVAELNSLRNENSELNRQVAILDRTSVMDQRATEEVQSTIRGLRERVAQLEQDIVYYRSVVSEETEDTGLTIGQLDLETGSEAGNYRYKLVLRQRDADGDTFLLGHVNVNLIGTQYEDQVILPLRDVSDDEDELDIRLRFKYFQNIEGELSLPEGFTPQRVQIAAVATEPVSKSINQDFSWVVEGE